MRNSGFIAATLAAATTFVVQELNAEEIRIAVAANFLSTLNALQSEFEAESDHTISPISGSTGLLYAQIRNYAPFDVLLAADAERPGLLGADGFGDPQSVFTYAIGRLVLWSANPALVSEATLGELGSMKFRWLAIAEPEIAPYGIAGRQTLEHNGIWESLQSRIVKGQNIAQAFAMAETGNAELGLVALAQALQYSGEASFALVPQHHYLPIRQDAIVLNAGLGKPGVTEFLVFLKSAAAARIIEERGYLVDASGDPAPN